MVMRSIYTKCTQISLSLVWGAFKPQKICGDELMLIIETVVLQSIILFMFYYLGSVFIRHAVI